MAEDIKEYLVFQTLRDVPVYNRIRAQNRYAVIKAFEKFLRKERQRLKKDFRIKAAQIKFAEESGISLRTLYRWIKAHRKKGLRGLVPNFGKLKKDEKNRKAITALVPDPGKTLSAKIEINLKNPLLALHQINLIVQMNPVFTAEVKEYSNKITEVIGIADGGNLILKLPRRLTEDEKNTLNGHLLGTHRNCCAKALGLLLMNEGCSLQELMLKTQRSRRTIFRWHERFEKEGISIVKVKYESQAMIEKRNLERVRVVDILHSPPMTFDINRSNWTLPSIIQAYEKLYGEHLAKGALKRVIKDARYTWKRARTMLTSNDPLYRQKVKTLITVLHCLTPNDAFFFIDEAGPWKVKKYGGKVLTAPDQVRTIPEYQPDKGAVYLIAALEAQTNQVIYQYIKGKTASAIVALLQELHERYSAYSRLCLTWDSLSSHSAKEVNEWIETANANSKRDSTPKVNVYPLPSNAQFLNVVESTFRNIRKAVIYNSDYQSVEEMQRAISRYLNERNAYFLENPRRAGNKIWDKELFTPDDLPGGLFRRM
ncbi:IS630 family transposase [Desulfuromonas acetoxidans]|nr:IS630 family transposase [Desulfuromonas acetoxidans]MBF0646401.1 IS630 family transposase [Desulfuromonas acetoxidans]NVD24384.1 IS630 family transposase [Desulfuromonas acetoxidans]NVE16668.1 IS630 family transposase [Desulfuromonas acetoxidans]